MHGSARVVEMLDSFSNELQVSAENDLKRKFLMEELDLLEKASKISLSSFLPGSAFHSILCRMMTRISSKPINLMNQLWDYVEEVVVTLLMNHSEDYPMLQVSRRRAAQNLIAKVNEMALSQVLEIVEMQKLNDYTCDP